MTATSRELVQQTLSFASPARAPRDLWTLPIAQRRYPDEYQRLLRDFPPDIVAIDGHERERVPTRGDQYAIGEYTDEWGSTFVNIQDGVIGEVKDPLIKDWETDAPRAHMPVEWLTLDRDAINRDCAATSKFTQCGACPRPFEQLQFLRGSPNLYMDLADPPPAMLRFLNAVHQFYCQVFEAWASTDIDSLRFMDDWGGQRALLIKPALWRELFKPLYRDYAQIAHARGKKLFMHSDGHIAAIYPDLIEIGIDAVNSQLFCMGVDALAPFAGQITFWGEIDRQYLLPFAQPDEVEHAVRDVHRVLWRNGGCIAQCEFGAGAKPANVRRVYETWERVAGASGRSQHAVEGQV
jgi:hypothetical protein